MPKRQMSENSLKNLQTEKYKFSKDNPEIAQKNQKKSVAKRTENKKLMQVAEAKLNEMFADGQTFQEKAIDIIGAMVLNGTAKPDEIIKLLTFLRDTAGQKPKDVVENITPPVLDIRGLNI